jgi:chemotaxis protein methyltransferase CheR
VTLPTVLLEDVARALADAVGLSLSGAGLDLTLADGLEAAARAEEEPTRAFARRVLAGDAGALTVLIEHLVVNETAFWRHPEQLEAIGRITAAAPGSLAIWSAGCASGEEPYSVAIALLEAGRLGRGDRILATDVSERALEAGAEAMYGVRAMRKLPVPLAARWFEPGVERRVRQEVRALVELRRHNLVADPPPGGPFDLVLCRNVLIYFDAATAAAVLRRLAGALRPGGLLVLGPVELPLADGMDLAWVEEGGATLLRRAR